MTMKKKRCLGGVWELHIRSNDRKYNVLVKILHGQIVCAFYDVARLFDQSHCHRNMQIPSQ